MLFCFSFVSVDICHLQTTPGNATLNDTTVLFGEILVSTCYHGYSLLNGSTIQVAQCMEFGIFNITFEDCLGESVPCTIDKYAVTYRQFSKYRDNNKMSGTVTRTSWHLKWLATWMFVQQLVQANTKEKIYVNALTNPNMLTPVKFAI